MLSAGTFSVTFPGGVPTYAGSGLALALGQARLGAIVATIQSTNPTQYGTGGVLSAAGVTECQAIIASLIPSTTAEAAAIIGYLTANAVISPGTLEANSPGSSVTTAGTAIAISGAGTLS